MKRIVLAFSKETTAEKIKRMLDGSGFEVCLICRSAAELARSVSDLDDILIIMGYKLPDGVVDDVYDTLREGQLLMSIVKDEQRYLIQNEEIFTVSLPVNREQIISSIEVLTGHIERGSKKSQRTPEEDKIIDSAKLYLMEKYRMTESQAQRFIQKRSMDTGAKFIDTAKLILNI